MKNTIPVWLAGQFARAKQNGWIASFRDAAAKYDFSVADLMAIASRESNMRNVRGDLRDGKYHGYSLMQLDIGSHKAWIESGKWTNPHAAILKGAEALAEKRNLILKASKQTTVTIRFRSGKTVKFIPKQFTGEQLRRITLASYNCGMAAYYHFSIGNDIDRGTTQKNYSADVVERSRDFADLLAKDTIGTAAREVEQVAPGETPAPAPLAEATAPTFNFDTMKDKASNYADAVKSPSVKTVAGKLGGKIAVGLGTVWGTTSGKIAITLSTIIVTSLVVSVIYKYRVEIKSFLKQGKDWAMKGVTQ